MRHQQPALMHGHAEPALGVRSALPRSATKTRARPRRLGLADLNVVRPVFRGGAFAPPRPSVVRDESGI